MTWRKAAVLTLSLLLILPGSAALAKTVEVFYDGASFDPATVQLYPGDKVKWTNTTSSSANLYTGTVCGEGSYITSLSANNSTNPHAYDTEGTYTYHNESACPTLITGTVNVVSNPHSELVLGSGDQVEIAPGTHYYSRVEISSGGDLILTGDTTIVVTGGGDWSQPDSEFLVDDSGSTVACADRDGLNGRGGSDGEDGTGEPGGHGGLGQSGGRGCNLTVKVNGDFHLRSGGRIDLSGGDGGDGGQGGDGGHGETCDPDDDCDGTCSCRGGRGGDGGNGGLGGRGGDGGDLTVIATGYAYLNGSSTNPSVLLDGGLGGSGGEGGYPGANGQSCTACGDYEQVWSTPGRAGMAAQGGNGGDLSITAQGVNGVGYAHGYVRSRGGKGGVGGDICTYSGSGVAGQGGDGGHGGAMDITAPCGVHELTAALSGGAGGRGGEAMDSYHRDGAYLGGGGGDGGSGGVAVIHTTDLGNDTTSDVSLTASGGVGGRGGDGEPVNCSCDCADGVCASRTCIGGQGGGGGDGGGGGTITVQGYTQGSATTMAALGGAGGDGGTRETVDCVGSGEDCNCDTTYTNLPVGGDGSDGVTAFGTISAGTVKLDKTVDKAEAQVGETLHYVIQPRGTGASGVIVSDVVPTNTTFQWASEGGVYNSLDRTITWDLGTLDDCPDPMSFQVTIDGGTAADTVISNQATADYGSGSSASSNTAATTVVAAPPDPPDTTTDKSRLGDTQDTQITEDPVNPGLLNFVYKRQFFALPGLSLPVKFYVYYNSLDADYLGPLGYGWTHSYNVVLTASEDNKKLTVKWGDGHEEYFEQQAGGGYAATHCHTRKTAEAVTGGWRVTEYNGVAWTFDDLGRLTSLEDLNGNQVVLSHSAHLDTITDIDGRVVTFTHVSDQLTQVELAFSPHARKIVEFGYTGDDLTSFTDLRGYTWAFGYDASHLLTSVTNPRGVVEATNYYDGGLIYRQTDGMGRDTWFEYSDLPDGGREVRISPPGGQSAWHTYDRAGNLIQVTDCEGEEASFTRDNQGHATRTTDKRGNSSQTAFDAAGNVTGSTSRRGHACGLAFNAQNRMTSYTDALGAVTQLTYDGDGNRLTQVDALGNSTSYANDAQGRLTAVTDPLGRTISQTYNAAGQLATVTQPDGSSISLTYDSLGRVIASQRTGGAAMAYTYDENGNQLTTEDYLGQETSFAYDQVGNHISTTFDPLAATTTYEHDALNRLIKKTDAMGGEWTYAYDGASNLYQVTDPDGVVAIMNYNANGDAIASMDADGHATTSEYDANGNLVKKTNHLGWYWTYAYDQENRLTSVTAPDGGVTSLAYDALGQLTTATDPMGRTVTQQYDALGRVVKTTGSGGAETGYTYDAGGRLTTLTGPRGNSWTFAYDDMDRMTRRTDPLGKSETYTYDALGRMTGKTTRDGQSFTFAYDDADRLVQVALPGGGAINYVYNARGQLTRMEDPDGAQEWTYDLLGRKTSYRDPYDQTVSYTYTPGGRLKTVTYPGSKVVTYAYDYLGRLTGVTDWLANETIFTYDALGRPTQVVLPNGTKRVYEYDGNGRLSRLSHQTAAGANICDYQMAFNLAGQLTSRDEDTQGVLGEPSTDGASFSYDAINRVLTRVQGGDTVRYSFDERGNLVSKSGGGEDLALTWDSRDRLTSTSGTGGAVAYGYDPGGQRITKTEAGVETRYLVDEGLVMASADDGGTVQSYYIHAGGMSYSLDASGNIRVYHFDQRGSITGITDDSGALVQSYDYGPYGGTTASSGALDNEFRYVGLHGVTTEANGLLLMGARYYDPRAGRFVSEDPLGLAAGVNLYAYTGGDPINRIDPSGLMSTAELAQLVQSGQVNPVDSSTWPPGVDWRQMMDFQPKPDAPPPIPAPKPPAPASPPPSTGPVNASGGRSVQLNVKSLQLNSNSTQYTPPPTVTYTKEQILNMDRDPGYIPRDKQGNWLGKYFSNAELMEISQQEMAEQHPDGRTLSSRINNLFRKVKIKIKLGVNGIKDSAKGFVQSLIQDIQYYLLFGSMPVGTYIEIYGTVGLLEAGAVLSAEFIIVAGVTYVVMECTGGNRVVVKVMKDTMFDVDNTPDEAAVLREIRNYKDIGDRCDRKYQAIMKLYDIKAAHD